MAIAASREEIRLRVLYRTDHKGNPPGYSMGDYLEYSAYVSSHGLKYSNKPDFIREISPYINAFPAPYTNKLGDKISYYYSKDKNREIKCKNGPWKNYIITIEGFDEYFSDWDDGYTIGLKDIKGKCFSF